MTLKIIFFTATVLFVIGALVLALLYRLYEDENDS